MMFKETRVYLQRRDVERVVAATLQEHESRALDDEEDRKVVEQALVTAIWREIEERSYEPIEP